MRSIDIIRSLSWRVTAGTSSSRSTSATVGWASGTGGGWGSIREVSSSTGSTGGSTSTHSSTVGHFGDTISTSWVHGVHISTYGTSGGGGGKSASSTIVTTGNTGFIGTDNITSHTNGTFVDFSLRSAILNSWSTTGVGTIVVIHVRIHTS